MSNLYSSGLFSVPKINTNIETKAFSGAMLTLELSSCCVRSTVILHHSINDVSSLHLLTSMTLLINFEIDHPIYLNSELGFIKVKIIIITMLYNIII